MQIGDFLSKENARKLAENTKAKGVPVEYVDRVYVVPKDCMGWKFTNDAKIIVVTSVKYTQVDGKYVPMISNYGSGYITKSVAYIPIKRFDAKLGVDVEYILVSTSKHITVGCMDAIPGTIVTTGEGEKEKRTWTASELLEGELTLGSSPQRYGTSTYDTPMITKA